MSLVAGLAPSRLVTPAAAQSAAEDPATERRELTSLRSERSKTFLEADGSRTGRFFTGPVHFRAADGAWQEIDTRLVPSSRPGYAWRNAAGAFTVHFAATASSERMVLVTDATSSIGFGLAGANPTSVAVVNGSTITYPGIRPGIDLVYEVRNGELKEDIVLHRAPIAPLVLDFPLALDNLTAHEVSSGALNLLTNAGGVGFRISDVWMVDSARQPQSEEPAFSEDLVSDLTGPVGDQTLRVVPSHRWLTAPERVYPVTIDPTTTKTTNDDTYVQSNILNTDVSGENEMKSGTFDAGATKARTLMKFADVQNQVPSGATITGANLFVYEFHSWSCTPRDVSVHRITDPWDGNSVRWSNQPGVAAAATTVNVAKGFSASCGAGWVTFDTLGTMVQYWKANNNNYGIEIRSPNEINNDWWKKWRPLGSGNAPYLEVYYTEPDITPPGKPTISSSTHPTPGTWFAASAPSFSWTTPNDASGIEGYSVKLDQVSNTFPDNAIDVYGNSTSYGAQSAGEHWFHVRAKDGAGNWSPEADHFKLWVDPVAPAITSLSSSSHPSQAAWSSTNDPCLTWSASDAHSGTSGYSFELTTNSGSTPDTTVDSTGGSTCFSDKADGIWYFRIRVRDNAGNWSPVSGYTVMIDANPATPSISSSTHSSPDAWYASRDVAFSWSATDESGIAGYSHQLTSGSPTTPDTTTEGTGTATSFSGLADGEWWLNVRAQNGVGTWGAAVGRRVRIDGTPPSASLSSSTHAHGAWANTNDPSFSFAATDLSGINGYSFVLDQNPLTNPDGTVDSGTGNMSFTDVADGIWYFHVRAQNGAGLWSTETRHFELRIDTAAPNVPVVSSSTHPTEGTVYAGNDPALSWTTSDTRSGVSAYSFVLDQSAATIPDAVADGSAAATQYGDVAEGMWWFHVRARDQAGNWGLADHFQIVIDVPAPYVIPILSGPAGQIDPDGEGAVKDGDLLTFSGAITEGAGGAPDRESAITTCDIVTSDSTGVEVKRIAVSLSSCKNDNGNVTGSVTPADLGTTDGTVALEVVATRSPTKSSGPRRSAPLHADNEKPRLKSATIGCQFFFTSPCSPARTIRVGLTERVKGTFRGRDFTVTGNTVLAANSTCTATRYCTVVRLTVAADIVSVQGVEVSYEYFSQPNTTRPVDLATNHMQASSRPLVDLEVTQGPAAPPFKDGDTEDAATELPATPAGQVLTLTVNTKQSCDQKDGECGAQVLRENLARRVLALATKPRGGSDIDGMGGVAPDVLLLQESNCAYAELIAKELNYLIKVRANTTVAGVIIPGDLVANPFTYRCLTDFEYQKDMNDDDKLTEIDAIYRADTPIIYNTATVEPLTFTNGQQDTGTTFFSRYLGTDRPAKCFEPATEHQEACQRLFKRHLALGFSEKQGTASVQVAVASIHLANGFHIHDDEPEDPDPEGVERYYELAAKWLTQASPAADRGIADLLQARYGAEIDFLSIGGDLNVRRCIDKNIEKQQGVACGVGLAEANTRQWWNNLTGAGYGYRDVVFAAHGTDEGMTQQYRDGCTETAKSDGTCGTYASRALRIDFVFSKSTLLPQGAPVGSHDITCGQRVGSSVANCDKDGTSGDRYSDHRLVWGLVGLNS